MKISFLIHNIFGVGGTNRTTLNLAAEMADRHEVEIVSILQHLPEPVFPIDPRITVVPLIETRPGHPSNEMKLPLYLQASQHFPRAESRASEYNALTDERVREHYADSDADVVIGTRPGLTAYVAQFAPTGAIRIGQEHMTFNHHKQALRAEMYEYLTALDAFVTVSEGDAAVHRAKMPLPTTQVLAIPNSVPEPSVAPSDGRSRTVVAAGRLAGEKQYEVLIDAFGKVSEERPDWELRIYGDGNQKDKLRKQIDDKGLYNHIHLMGRHSPIEPEWSKGSIAVSTSRHESFGMTILEAMRCGLPVVSTDCDYGPREILTPGEDGLLVPVGDVDAVAEAILTLINDEPRRRKMAAAALRNARRFDPAEAAKTYEHLFAELAAAAESRLAAGAVKPVADCVVNADGGLSLTLVGAAGQGMAPQGARLLWSRTNDRNDVRYFDFDADGTAVVPAGADFPEGIWDALVQLPGSARRFNVTARNIDQRGAMHSAERPADQAVRNLVPYVSKDKGLMALRSWSRPVHAEIGDITVADGMITVLGDLYGPVVPSASPTLLLRRRVKPSDEIKIVGERRGERGLRFVIPCNAPAARQLTEHDVWDLWIRYAPDTAAIKVGRVLDDVLEKKAAYVYPMTVLPKAGNQQIPFSRKVARRVRGAAPGSRGGRVRVRVFYTITNDLALNVVDL